MEGDSRQQENIKSDHSNMVHDGSSVLQSSWIRRSPILANCFNWESMERQHRFVLYSGIVLWFIHLTALFT
jgi:hypothetical protein